MHYSYRLMVRENEDHHILKCRRGFYQYNVDMYVKFVTAIDNYQIKIEPEKTTFRRDVLNADGNAQNITRLMILPPTLVGSPRYMHVLCSSLRNTRFVHHAYVQSTVDSNSTGAVLRPITHQSP